MGHDKYSSACKVMTERRAGCRGCSEPTRLNMDETGAPLNPELPRVLNTLPETPYRRRVKSIGLPRDQNPFSPD